MHKGITKVTPDNVKKVKEALKDGGSILIYDGGYASHEGHISDTSLNYFKNPWLAKTGAIGQGKKEENSREYWLRENQECSDILTAMCQDLFEKQDYGSHSFQIRSTGPYWRSHCYSRFGSTLLIPKTKLVPEAFRIALTEMTSIMKKSMEAFCKKYPNQKRSCTITEEGIESMVAYAVKDLTDGEILKKQKIAGQMADNAFYGPLATN